MEVGQLKEPRYDHAATVIDITDFTGFCNQEQEWAMTIYMLLCAVFQYKPFKKSFDVWVTSNRNQKIISGIQKISLRSLSNLKYDSSSIHIVQSLFLSILSRLSMINYNLYTLSKTVSDTVFIQTKYGHCDPQQQQQIQQQDSCIVGTYLSRGQFMTKINYQLATHHSSN